MDPVAVGFQSYTITPLIITRGTAGDRNVRNMLSEVFTRLYQMLPHNLSVKRWNARQIVIGLC